MGCQKCVLISVRAALSSDYLPAIFRVGKQETLCFCTDYVLGNGFDKNRSLIVNQPDP